MREFNEALESSNAERAIGLTRVYYQRVDGAFMQALKAIMSQRKKHAARVPRTAGRRGQGRAKALAQMPLPLERTLALLEELAPLRYAQEWDNVGLLLGTLGEGEHAPSVTRVLLTIDLTEAVLEEARTAQAELVVAYHPPLFRPTKRLDAARPTSRVLLRAARAGIALYSPHTALDAAPGGMNDWLAAGLGTGTQAPLIDANVLDPNAELKLVTFVPAAHVDGLRTALALAGAGVIGDYNFCSSQSPTTGTFLGGDTTKPVVGARGQLETVPEVRLEMVCPKHALGRIARALRGAHPYEEPAWDLYPLAPRPAAGFGIGRSLSLLSRRGSTRSSGGSSCTSDVPRCGSRRAGTNARARRFDALPCAPARARACSSKRRASTCT